MSEQPDPVKPDPEKKPRGQAGGEARAAKLTAEQRSEIAKKAAEARWDE